MLNRLRPGAATDFFEEDFAGGCLPCGPTAAVGCVTMPHDGNAGNRATDDRGPEPSAFHAPALGGGPAPKLPGVRAKPCAAGRECCALWEASFSQVEGVGQGFVNWGPNAGYPTGRLRRILGFTIRELWISHPRRCGGRRRPVWISGWLCPLHGVPVLALAEIATA